MPFASRADLLARSNARRLAQLAVPADCAMVPDDALRAAVAGGNLTGYSADDQASLTLALDAIDKALADADALIESYGIPADVHTTLLARLASTIALYYLQGAERMTEDVRNGYTDAIATLKAHARGELALVPVPEVPDPAAEPTGAEISSNPSRYGRAVDEGDF